MIHRKIYFFINELVEWTNHVSKLVVTNGCFDILHIGHISCLQRARDLGSALLVGINNDESVRQLKGPGRPLNPAIDRAEMIAALECVDGVFIFNGMTATWFLERTKPKIWAKGGDYTREKLNPEEVIAVENGGGEVVIIPMVPGKSTTNLIQRIALTAK